MCNLQFDTFISGDCLVFTLDKLEGLVTRECKWNESDTNNDANQLVAVIAICWLGDARP